MISTPSGAAASPSDLFVPPAPYIAANIAITGRLPFGVPTSVIVNSGQAAMYLFDRTAGQRLNIRVQGGPVSGQHVTIYRPDGQVLKERGTLRNSLRWTEVITAPVSGTYTAVITGDGTVTLFDVPPDVGGTIRPDRVGIPITITTPGQNGRLTFLGTAGQRVAVTFTSNTLSYTYLTFRSPDGAAIVHGNVGSGDQVVEVLTLPLDGLYSLMINPWDGYIGKMTITMYDVPPDVHQEIGTDGVPATVDVSTAWQNAYLTFHAAAGERITMTADGTFTGSTSCCNAVGNLFSPTGSSMSFLSYLDGSRFWDAKAISMTGLQITNANGEVVARYDPLPFGEEPPNQWPVYDPIRFAGKEHDYETHLAYFGARDYQSQTGRFTSPDPITVNTLRMVNPQRWSRYTYAVNNPLKYTDPDGLDALLINYTDGAQGLGHVGIMALNPNGSGLYGGFNPVHAGSIRDAGVVKNMSFGPGSVAFGAGGRPTIASLNKLREQLASLDGKSPHAIRIRHIKTSEAETAALAAYIKQNIGSPGKYNVFSNNCLDFSLRGLEQAGIVPPPPSAIPGGFIPDLYFRSFLLDLAARLAEQRVTVETSYCIQGMDCR